MTIMPLDDLPLCPWIHACGDTDRPGPWAIAQRRLTHWLVVYNRRGEERLRVDGVTHHIGPGQAYLIGPGELADLEARRGSWPAWVHCDLVFDPQRHLHPQVGAYQSSLESRRQWLQPGAEAVFGTPLPRLAPPALVGRISRELPELIARWHQGHALARADAAAALWRLLLAWAQAGNPPRSGPVDDLDRVAAAALAQLESMTVVRLAALAGCSRSHLGSAWPQRFGCAPGVWLRRQRLLRAEGLLQRPELTLHDIARLCGWAEAGVLVRAWRTAYGHPPRSGP